MKCDEFEEHLQQMLDRRRPLHRAASLWAHAQKCRACRGLLDAYEDLLAGLELFEPPALNEDFAQRVVRQVEPARPAVRRWVKYLRLTAAALAAGLLLTLLPGLRARVARPQPAPPITRTALPAATAPAVAAVVPVPPPASAAADATVALVPPVAPERLRAVWQHWAMSLSQGPLEPVDGIAGGLRPITTSLTVALDVIRNAIPLGREHPPKAESSDSARYRRGSERIRAATTQPLLFPISSAVLARSQSHFLQPRTDGQHGSAV
jgi:hypothetical protein